MLVSGVASVVVFVTDMERSLAWYQDVLELPLKARHGDDFAVLDTEGVPLALHGGSEPSEDQSRGITVVLAVADYAAAKKTLESRGCVFVFENDSPAAIFGTLLDPDGNALQIQQRR